MRSNKRLTATKHRISSRRAVASVLSWWKCKIPSSAKARLPKHNPISVTSLKCILLAGTIHPKCQVSCRCCNKRLSCQLAARRRARAQHSFNASCAALASAAVSLFHQQGCRKQLWAHVEVGVWFLPLVSAHHHYYKLHTHQSWQLPVMMTNSVGCEGKSCPDLTPPKKQPKRSICNIQEVFLPVWQFVTVNYY